MWLKLIQNSIKIVLNSACSKNFRKTQDNVFEELHVFVDTLKSISRRCILYYLEPVHGTK